MEKQNGDEHKRNQFRKKENKIRSDNSCWKRVGFYKRFNRKYHLEQIEVIRRLIEDLELDLPTIDIVLRMRERIINLLNELGTLEDEMYRRHSQLENEITILRRRIAEEAKWENET